MRRLSLLSAALAWALPAAAQITTPFGATPAVVSTSPAASPQVSTAPLGAASTGQVAPYNMPGATFSPGGITMPFNTPGAAFGTPAPGITPGTLTPGTPAPSVSPQPAPAPTPKLAPPTTPTPHNTRVDAEDERTARSLDEENVERHRRLHEQFLARRRLLTDSDTWKLSSRAERKAQLRALKTEYREREQWLRDDYLQKRDGMEGYAR